MKLLCVLVTLFFSITSLAKPLTVVLDWFANPNHAPIFVAKQQGYFKKLGLSINIITPANPADPPKLVASHHADIALDYQPDVIEQVARDLPIIQIGTLIATPLTSIITLKSSKIHSLADLKGKTLAGSANDLVLRAMLKNNGLKLKNVKIVDVGYNLIQALLSGKAEAASGMDRNVELIELKQLGKQVRVFYPEENHVPIYSGLVYIANKNNLHDPRLRKFMRAVTLGTQYLINHPEECWEKFAENHPELNNKTTKAEWFATLSRFALRPNALDPSRIEQYAQFMKKMGVIRRTPAANKIAASLAQ